MKVAKAKIIIAKTKILGLNNINHTQVFQKGKRRNVYWLTNSTLHYVFTKTKCRANVKSDFHFYIETQTLHRRNGNVVSQEQIRFYVETKTFLRRNGIDSTQECKMDTVFLSLRGHELIKKNTIFENRVFIKYEIVYQTKY